MDLTPAVIGIIVGLSICIVALVIVLIVFFTGRRPLVDGNMLVRPIDCNPKYRCVGRVGYMTQAEEEEWRQQKLRTHGMDLISPVREYPLRATRGIYLPETPPIVTLPPPTPPRPEATFFPASPPIVRRQIIERAPTMNDDEQIYLPSPRSPAVRNLPQISPPSMVYNNQAFDNHQSWQTEDDMDFTQYRPGLPRRTPPAVEEAAPRVIQQTPARTQAMPTMFNVASQQAVQETNQPSSYPYNQSNQPSSYPHNQSGAVVVLQPLTQSADVQEAPVVTYNTPAAFPTGPTSFFANQQSGHAEYEEQEEHTGVFQAS